MTEVLLAIVITVGVVALLAEQRRQRREQLVISLLGLFGPVMARGRHDPRELVAWSGAATTARRLFPDACAALDRAMEDRFPFSNEFVEAAHARWTVEWLAWERQHDTEYKNRAASLEATLEGAAPDGGRRVRAELAAIEQEKLQTYQRRYEDYVRVGHMLASMETGGSEGQAAVPEAK